MAAGIVCAAKPGCQGLATPEHPICSCCQRERRLDVMRQSPSAVTHTLARVLSLIPHHDPGLEAGS